MHIDRKGNTTVAAERSTRDEQRIRRSAERRRSVQLERASLAFGLAVLAMATAAYAQEEKRRPSVVEEVVVTAQKRSENIQDVPVAVTAFTAEMRQETGIESAQQQLNFTPGVTYEGPGIPSGRLTIRGIGQASLGPFGLDPGVAVYQDGFYVANPEFISGSTLAVERTEVLRGPQGTLYGRNAIGGALNSISRRPSDTLETEARVGVNDFDGYDFEGRVAGPLFSTLRGSVRFTTTHQEEGYYKNLNGGEDEGGNGDTWSADAQFSFDIGSSIKTWVRYLTQGSETHPRNLTAVSNPDPANTPTGLAGINNQGLPNVFFGIGPQYGTTGARTFDTNRSTKRDVPDFDLVITEVLWNASDTFDAKYLFGSLETQTKLKLDRDATSNSNFLYPRDLSFGQFPANFDTNPATVPTNPADLSDPNVEASFVDFRNDLTERQLGKFDSMSHEINLTSTGDGNLNWLLGLFYYDEKSSFNIRSTYLDNPFYTGVVPDADFVKSAGRLETRSTAVFGQLDYDFTPQWHGTLGLRRTHDRKEGTEGFIYTGLIPSGTLIGGAFVPFDIRFATCGAIACGAGADGVVDNPLDPTGANQVDNTRPSRKLKDSYDAVTGTLGLQYTPSAATNLYATYSRGYKSGGFNLGNDAPDPSVDEESVDTFEIGWKQRVGQSLRVNSAVFFYKYNDLQLTNGEILNNIQVTSLVNVDEVENFGVELEAIWFPFKGLTVQANYAYLHSEITKGCCFGDTSDPAALQPGAKPVTPPVVVNGIVTRQQSLVGNSLPGSPENKLGLNVAYGWELPVGFASVAATYTYRDGFFAQVFNTPNWDVASADSVDLRLVWRSTDDRITVLGTVTNLFDQEVPISVFTGTPQQSNFQTLTLQPPRIYSAQLQYRF
jgi:iron complex outermembrane receptor protein